MSGGRTPDTGPDLTPDVLPCGARVDLLLDQVSAGGADRLDDHQAGCPHCRASLAEYDRLWAPVRAAARTDVHAPESVLDEAMRRIREAAAEPESGEIVETGGRTRVGARVVVVTARETARTIPGVRAALGRLALPGVVVTGGPADGGPRVAAGMSGRSTAVEIVLAADHGIDLIDLGARIRAEVAARVREVTGLEPVSVTVHVDDVLP